MRYRFVVPRTQYCIVDFKSAELVCFDGISEPRYARRVTRWAVDPSSVPPLDLFSDQLGLTIATHEVSSVLDSASGLREIHLDVLDDPLLGNE